MDEKKKEIYILVNESLTKTMIQNEENRHMSLYEAYSELR